MTIRPMAAHLFQADGQTDRHDEAKSHLSQFCECARRTNCTFSSCYHVCFCLIFLWRFDPITGHGQSDTGLRDYSVGRSVVEP